MSRGVLINIILGGVVALLPLFTRIAHLDVGRVSKDNLLAWIMVGVMLLMPERKRVLPWYSWSLVAYCFLILAFNHWNVVSLNVVIQAFYLIIGGTFFIALYERIDLDSTDHVLNGLAVGCIIQSVFAICNHFGINLYESMVLAILPAKHVLKESFHVRGSLGNSNLLGAYLALSFPALIRRNWWLALSLPIVAVLLSWSLMGIFSLAAGVLYLINYYYGPAKKSLLYIVALVGMVLVPFLDLGNIDSSRFKGWGMILSLADLKHFLIGRGPGWFADLGLVVHDQQMWAQEHNEYLGAFNVFGIFGILLSLPWLVKFLRSKTECPLFESILFAAFVNAYGHFTLHQSTTAIIVIIAAAVCLAERDKHEWDMER